LQPVHHGSIKAVGHIVEDQNHTVEVKDAHAAILPPFDTIPGLIGEEELAFGRLLDARACADGLDPGEETHVVVGDLILLCLRDKNSDLALASFNAPVLENPESRFSQIEFILNVERR
jgi:hypothetical protein